MPVEVPDDLAPALADLAILGAAARSRRDGGGHLHPDLAALLRHLAGCASATRVSPPAHAEAGDTRPAASPVIIATTGEAARVLGCSPQRVRLRAAAGTIPGRKVGRDWLIELHPEDVRDADGGADRAGRSRR